MRATDPSNPRPGWLRDLLSAARFLTRAPLPADDAEFDAPFDAGERPLLRAGWRFPAVGAAVGLAAGLVLWLAAWIGLPPLAAALAGIAAGAAFTGALHEDGLADFADGLGGGGPEARIAIMRDSRTGTYGALALVLATGLKAAALAALAERDAGLAVCALVAVHAAGRATIIGAAAALEPADEAGLGRAAGRPDRAAWIGALALGGALAAVLLPLGAALAAAAGALAGAAAVAELARRRLGGYTGDVLGAVEQAAEVLALLAVAAALARA